MNRVLLTGAGGYIGRHMPADLVARGFEVHAVSNSGRNDLDGVTWHSANLLDSDATDALLGDVKPTHLVHLAWVTEHDIYWQSPLNRDWLNASTALIEGFARHGGTRAVLTGTCAEYDWTDGHCVENLTPLRGRSLYARSKLEFRDAAQTLADKSDFSFAWCRVFFSFGPHERAERLVPAVIRALLAGKRARCGDGDLVRDFMYVLDTASAMVAVLDSDLCGDVNIASGQARTLEDIVHRIAVRLDGRERVDFGHYPRRRHDPKTITADISRLSDATGWSPAYDLDTALDRTIAWWKNQAK